MNTKQISKRKPEMPEVDVTQGLELMVTRQDSATFSFSWLVRASSFGFRWSFMRFGAPSGIPGNDEHEQMNPFFPFFGPQHQTREVGRGEVRPRKAMNAVALLLRKRRLHPRQLPSLLCSEVCKRC